MKKTPYDFCFHQGDDHQFEVIVNDASGSAVDLTGYSYQMMGRTDYNADATVFDLTVGDGITLTEAEGKIEIEIADTITEGVSGWRVCL